MAIRAAEVEIKDAEEEEDADEPENFEVLPASGDENRISDNPGEAVKQLASDKAASFRLGEADAKIIFLIITSSFLS